MQPLLEVRGVSKNFGGLVALDNLSLTVSGGDLQCVIGPNGCGKTTLFNVITGALRPSAGEIYFAGKKITHWKSHRIARAGISRKFQVPGIYPSLTVAENLEVPLASAHKNWGPWRLLRSSGQQQSLAELLDWCGLTHKAGELAGALAHGEKQWLEIAMTLASDAELILLDEPTAGMSITETEKTAQLVRRLREDSGKTVLAIEHDMTFVEKLDCRVLVLMRGQVIKEGTFAEVRADTRVIESYLGKSENAGD